MSYLRCKNSHLKVEVALALENDCKHRFRPRGHKTFLMLISCEHGIYLTNNIKMPTTVGILIFISKINFMLSSIQHEKC